MPHYTEGSTSVFTEHVSQALRPKTFALFLQEEEGIIKMRAIPSEQTDLGTLWVFQSSEVNVAEWMSSEPASGGKTRHSMERERKGEVCMMMKTDQVEQFSESLLINAKLKWDKLCKLEAFVQNGI